MKKNFASIALIVAGFLMLGGASVLSKSSSAPLAPETVVLESSADQTRCGWFSNPTPGNFWLDDRDGEWIIGTQGGFQAEGDYPPVFKKGQWIKTNGNYGYGCACVKGTFNADTKEVEVVKSASARPLSACRKDKNLKEPK